MPDTYLLLLALASPAGVRAVPDLVDKARLQQTRVTKELRVQARQAVERFVQEVLDHPDNPAGWPPSPTAALARQLWHEGLVLVYRLLFMLKLEASDDPAQAFSFASTSLWRNTFSPSVALAPYARRCSTAARRPAACWRTACAPCSACSRTAWHAPSSTSSRWAASSSARTGRRCSRIWPGASGRWPISSIACSGRRNGAAPRPGNGSTTARWTSRTWAGSTRRCWSWSRASRRDHVPPAPPQAGSGRPPRPRRALPPCAGCRQTDDLAPEEDEAGDEEEDEEEEAGRGRATKVEWVEEIPPGRFYLRVGLGRKASGSFYTPHSFVRFLVQETLGPLVERLQPARRSPGRWRS